MKWNSSLESLKCPELSFRGKTFAFKFSSVVLCLSHTANDFVPDFAVKKIGLRQFRLNAGAADKS
jgi:hypothetical protein